MTPDVHTFVFADLAGYTAFTEAHGDDDAADAALAFCHVVNACLPDDAEDLKMLGDSCLLRVGQAREAVLLGLELTGTLTARHGFLDVRVGMHTGTAARRGSDYFGSAVNIAARVAALAQPGEVLVTEETHDAAGDVSEVGFEASGTHRLRHVPTPITLLSVRALDSGSRGNGWLIDPVCRMRLDIDHALVVADDRGERHFCSAACAELFAADPHNYMLGQDEPR